MRAIDTLHRLEALGVAFHLQCDRVSWERGAGLVTPADLADLRSGLEQVKAELRSRRVEGRGPDAVAADLLVSAEERAAIREFDGGVSRSEAERATAEELAREGLVVPDWPPS